MDSRGKGRSSRSKQQRQVVSTGGEEGGEGKEASGQQNLSSGNLAEEGVTTRSKSARGGVVNTRSRAAGVAGPSSTRKGLQSTRGRSGSALAAPKSVRSSLRGLGSKGSQFSCVELAPEEEDPSSLERKTRSKSKESLENSAPLSTTRTRQSPSVRGRKRRAGGPSLEEATSTHGKRSRHEKLSMDSRAGSSRDISEHREDEGPSSADSDRGANTFKGFFNRLSSGIDDLLPSAVPGYSRLKQLIITLRSSSSDDVRRSQALTELCDVLSVGTEETMAAVSVEAFVPPLVELLDASNAADLRLLAARALSHMMDALPASTSVIAHKGAAVPLCASLHAIEYIDLAEQSLSALQKLSVDHSPAIVRAGGFAAALNFFDFFSIGLQRVSASLACNLCQNTPSDAFPMVVDVLPVFTMLLDNDDQRIRESAMLSFSRLVESYKQDSVKLETICGEHFILLDKTISFVTAPPPAKLGPLAFSAAMRMLGSLARGSANLSKVMLGRVDLLLGLKEVLQSVSSAYILDCLSVAESLLPLGREIQEDEELTRIRRGKGGFGYGSVSPAVEVAKQKYLAENPSILEAYGDSLFVCLLNNLNSSVNFVPRKMTLLALGKFVYNAPAEILSKLIVARESTDSSSEISAVQFASYVASLLGENNSSFEVVAGLVLIRSTMDKLAKEVRGPFIREGVLHQLQRLSTIATEGGEGKSPSTEKQPASSPEDSRGKETGVSGEALKDKQKEKEKEKAPWQTRNSAEYTEKKARDILEKHFNGAESDMDGDGQELQDAKDLAKKLLNVTTTAEAVLPIEEFVKVLSGEKGMSTFELSRSGLIDALLSFFDGDESAQVKVERLKLFATQLTNANEDTFSTLLSRVYGVLAAEDKLMVCVNENSSGNVVSAASGLRQLAQPLKLRLKRASATEGGSNLKDYSHHVVLIDPLATFLSVEDFLWPRVKTPTAVYQLTSSFGEDSQVASADVQVDLGIGDIGEVHSLLDEDGDGMVFGFEEEEDDEIEDGEEDEDEAVGEEDGQEGHDMDSSASGEEIESDEEDMDDDENDDDMSDDGDDFGVDHMSSSLPPVELDLDGMSPHPKQCSASNPTQESTRSGVGSSMSPQTYAAAVANDAQSSRGRHSAGGRELSTHEKRPRQHIEKLVFKLNNEEISRDLTILQGVLSQANRNREREMLGADLSHGSGRRIGSRIWEEIHTLTYSLSVPLAEAATQEGGGGDDDGNATCTVNEEKTGDAFNGEKRGSSGAGVVGEEIEPVKDESKARAKSTGHIILPVADGFEELSPQLKNVVRLTQYLHCVNKFVGDLTMDRKSSFVAEDRFVSNTLTGKLLRQISDPLSLCGGMIPKWIYALARNAPYLFPFDSRLALLQSTGLDITRALHRLQSRADAMAASGGGNEGRHHAFHREGEGRMGRIMRQKVKTDRSRPLESAIRVMDTYATQKTMIEIQYYNEPGTGLGPTLEFYTTVSKELQRADLNLWRSKGTVKVNRNEVEVKSSRRRSRGKSHGVETGKDTAVEYVVPTGDGLFPAPIASGDGKDVNRVLDMFRFMGRLFGKVLTDGRLLDLRISAEFAQLIILSIAKAAKRKSSNLEDYMISDSENVNYDLRTLASVDPVLASSLRDMQKMRDSAMDDDSGEDCVKDLCLFFTVPGYDKIELGPGGKNKPVTKDNLNDYIDAVLRYLLVNGVKRQVAEFVAGLSEVVDGASLLYFQPEELNLIFCGPECEEWSTTFLVHSTKCDHGYTHESHAVINLLRVLTELSPEDQRKFLQFATGSPRLPVGGLGNLRPRLTIVKRTPEPGHPVDESLPTVMTCTNYLKLPDYSTYEMTRRRLLFAIREGQGSFDLS